MSDEPNELQKLLALFPDATTEQKLAILEHAMRQEMRAYIRDQYRTAAEAVRRQALEEKLSAAEMNEKPTYKKVIERYNRAHAQNKKITLKQICEEMNVNYDSIRTLKSRLAKQKNRKRNG